MWITPSTDSVFTEIGIYRYDFFVNNENVGRQLYFIFTAYVVYKIL